MTTIKSRTLVLHLVRDTCVRTYVRDVPAGTDAADDTAAATAARRQQRQRQRRRGGHQPVHVLAGKATVDAAVLDLRRVTGDGGHRRQPRPAERRAGGVPARVRAVGGRDPREVRGGVARRRHGGHHDRVLPPHSRRQVRRVRLRLQGRRRGGARPRAPAAGRADTPARGAEVGGDERGRRRRGRAAARRRPGVGGGARDRPRARARPLVVGELDDVQALQGEGEPHRRRRQGRPGAVRCQTTTCRLDSRLQAQARRNYKGN